MASREGESETARDIDPVPDARQVPLTQDDLSLVMDRALARHREARQRAEGHLPTLADALEIARQLDLPEEHVLAAAAELPQLRAREEARKQRRRQLKISAWVGGYSGALSTGICVAASVAVQAIWGTWWGMVSLLGMLPLLIGLWVYLAWYFWYCLKRPISEGEVDQVLGRTQGLKVYAPVVIDGEVPAAERGGAAAQ